MKKIYLLFLGLSLLACQNDEGNTVIGGPQEATLVTTWRLVDWYTDEPIDINGDGNASTSLWDQWNGCRKHTLMELLSDQTTRLTYTGPNNNPKCPPGTQTNDSYFWFPWDYVEDENTILFLSDDTAFSYQIVELTVNSLVLDGAGFLTCCDADISYHTDGYLRFVKEEQ